MPFPTQFTPTAGADAYIQDPDPNFTAQYRCRIISAQPLKIGIFPDANVEPNIDLLPMQYLLGEPDISAKDLTAMPALNIEVKNYADVLRQQNIDPGKWAPAADADSPMVGIEDAKVPGSKKVEGQIEKAPEQNLTPPPGQPFTVDAGEVLQILPSDHSFWGPLSGKDALVLEVNGGIISVEIEGAPYPNVEVGRFQRKPATTSTGTPTGITSEVAVQMQGALKWVGQDVHIKNAKIDSSFRGHCEAVNEEGIKLQNISTPISWDQVGAICPMNDEPIPGDDKDEARISKKKGDESATRDQVISEITDLIEKRAEKETFGKREYRKMVDRWKLLLQKIEGTSPVQQVLPGTTATEQINATKQAGYEEACADIKNVIDQMLQP